MNRLTNPAGPGHIDVGGRQVSVGVNADMAAGLAGAIPLGRLGAVQEAAGAAYCCAPPEADHITGEVPICAGAYTFWPRPG
ncbi:hypothetical protein AB0B66_23635 [Catellatospora sp. NPDC049111]|uniref:hypothetical protein n=1 Tax=Catellatospora sp. NPDC049111 TaxID=3155271 RepID=UPI0033FB4247